MTPITTLDKLLLYLITWILPEVSTVELEFVSRVGYLALWNAFLIAAPLLGIGVIVGLVISIFQTATSIQEQTLTFAPKILALMATLGLLGTWMVNRLMSFTLNLWSFMTKIP
jgi:flagellar biosynthetic protein FliQ